MIVRCYQIITLVVMFCLVGLNTPVFSLEDSAKKEEALKAEEPKRDWKPLYDGKTLDNWDIPPVGGEGPVEIEGKNISIGMGVGITAIRYTNDFSKWDYEIVYEARRKMGHDFFGALTFPVGENHCSFINGGWGGGTIGLSCIDGRDASDNMTNSYYRFDSKYWYQFRVRVTQGKITVWIKKQELAENEKVLASEKESERPEPDPNEPVIDFVIDDHQIGLRYETNDLKPLGIATWITEGLIRRIDYRMLTPDEIAQSVTEVEAFKKKYNR